MRRTFHSVFRKRRTTPCLLTGSLEIHGQGKWKRPCTGCSASRCLIALRKPRVQEPALCAEPNSDKYGFRHKRLKIEFIENTKTTIAPWVACRGPQLPIWPRRVSEDNVPFLCPAGKDGLLCDETMPTMGGSFMGQVHLAFIQFALFKVVVRHSGLASVSANRRMTKTQKMKTGLLHA